MKFDNTRKNLFGQIFLILSILILAYMLISPLNHIITSIGEYFTITTVNFPITDILTISKGEFNPPLYYLLAKLATKFLGNSVALLKILSVIPYAIIILVSTIKIRKDYGWLTAGIFALSMGVMSEFFTYFLMARMFSWAVLFTVLAFVFLRDIMTNDNKISWILFTVFSILAAYTHYFAGLTVAVIYLFLLIYILKNNREKIKFWAASAVVAIILYVPWILTLLNQIQALEPSLMPKVNLDLIMTSLGYFITANGIVFGVGTILILIALGIIYFTQKRNIDDEDQFYIITGIGAFLAILIIGIAISAIYKPVLMPSCMIFASATLWVAVSILIGKITSRRLFLISFALIVLVLISGVATAISTNNTLYNENIANNEAMAQITQDDDSIVILTNPRVMAYFLGSMNNTDMYCINQSHVYGDPIDRVHAIYDFNDITEAELNGFVANNTDKNIYIITFGQFNLNNYTKEVVFDDSGYQIIKINITAPAV